MEKRDRKSESTERKEYTRKRKRKVHQMCEQSIVGQHISKHVNILSTLRSTNNKYKRVRSTKSWHRLLHCKLVVRTVVRTSRWLSDCWAKRAPSFADTFFSDALDAPAPTPDVEVVSKRHSTEREHRLSAEGEPSELTTLKMKPYL